MCRRFDTIPACDGRADGQTDEIAVASTTLAMRALRRAVKIGSVCLCHGQHAVGDRRYFLAPCDNRPPARPARIPLADTLCGYRIVVSVSSAL